MSLHSPSTPDPAALPPGRMRVLAGLLTLPPSRRDEPLTRNQRLCDDWRNDDAGSDHGVRSVSAERYRRVHIDADRRAPFGHVGARRPEPVPLTTNQRAGLWLTGLAWGVLATLLLTGAPW